MIRNSQTQGPLLSVQPASLVEQPKVIIVVHDVEQVNVVLPKVTHTDDVNECSSDAQNRYCLLES